MYLQHPNPTPAKTIEQGGVGMVRPPGVVDQIDFHTGRPPGQEQVCKARPFLGLEFIAFHVDAAPGRSDRGRHRGVGCRAVQQQLHLVAREEGLASDALALLPQQMEHVSVAGALRGAQDIGIHGRHCRGAPGQGQQEQQDARLPHGAEVPRKRTA